MELIDKHPVCDDCKLEIGENEIAIERGGELLCLDCVMKSFDVKCSAPRDFLEWLLGDNLTYGRHFIRKYIDEERVVWPRERDIA